MTTSRILNALVIALVIGAIAWGLSLIKLPEPESTVQHVLPGEVSPQGDFVYRDETKHYVIEVRYPQKTSLSGSADINARRSIEAGMLEEVTEFRRLLSEFLTDEEKARLEQIGAQYSFGAEYKEYISPKFTSFLYAIYQDTGGAHPNGYFRSFVFNEEGNRIGIGDLFEPGSDYLARLSQESLAQIRQQLTERIGADATESIFAEGVSAREENFQVFALEDDTLHVFFPPYQVAAYAAGSFDVEVPLQSLASILRPEIR